MTITTLNPFRLVQILLANQKAKLEENRRRSALFRARDAFEYFNCSLDELIDSEVELLIRHSGEIATEIARRKNEVIMAIVSSSAEAINQ